MSVEQAVREAYVRGQRREMAIVLFWAVVIVALGVSFSESVQTALPFAALVLAEVAIVGLLGGELRGRVLSFLLLGTLPMLTALSSSLVGHACTPSGCVSLCAPLCAFGGGISGLLLSRMAFASERPFLSWSLGAALIVSTGAIGCACVGTSGVLGMLLGLISSTVLFGARTWVRRTLST